MLTLHFLSYSLFMYVRQYYVAVVDKVILKFPFHDPILNSLGFLDPDMRDTNDADTGM